MSANRAHLTEKKCWTWLRILRPVFGLLAMPLLFGVPAWASDGADTNYQPYVPNASSGNVSAPLYVIIAYSTIWVVLLLFLVSIWRRQKATDSELKKLQQQLGERR